MPPIKLVGLHDPWSRRSRVKNRIDGIYRHLTASNNRIEKLDRKLKTVFGIASSMSSWESTTQFWSREFPPYLDYRNEQQAESKHKALVAYVCWPFYASEHELDNTFHANGPQAIHIAVALNSLGYVVDIVDMADADFVATNGKYSLLFGEGPNFGRMMRYLSPKATKIYYGTRSHWHFEMPARQKRLEALQERRGYVQSKQQSRIFDDTWIEASDAIIVIGNEFVQDTYRPFHKRVYGIDNSAIPTGDVDWDAKDFAEAKKNFLWLGSVDLIHKGLDLVLETFVRHPQLHLWVCGALQGEREFTYEYRRELFHTPNIHPIGWTNIHSEGFDWLTQHCAFAILASCSEAMAGSILTCMGRGLIPVISKEVGLDVENFGFLLKDSEIGTIEQAILQLSHLSTSECVERANEAYRLSRDRYTYDAFRTNIENTLADIIQNQ